MKMDIKNEQEKLLSLPGKAFGRVDNWSNSWIDKGISQTKSIRQCTLIHKLCI